MSRNIIPISRFAGGISDSEKEGLTSSFLWSQSCDYRTDPSKLLLLPRTTKDSGTVVTGLILDGDRVGDGHYFCDDAGGIYKRTVAGVWTKERTVADSHGNGMAYFGEDQFLYYTSDTVIGRYGQINAASPTWSDNFMGAQGGIPLNTNSLTFNGSSQYMTAADSASLSITGDLSLEGWFRPHALPAAAAEVGLITKWDGLSDERSYGLALAAISAYFGDGGDGALTILSDTTQAPVDSACTGTAASYSLSATNAAFAAGQKVLIHQSRGTNTGKWERNEIASYTAGTISLSNALTNTYVSGAQVIVLAEYTNVTVNSGKTWTAKAWNGTVGGILCFLASGTVTVTGAITALGKGFRRTESDTGDHGGVNYQGEGSAGAASASNSANGNGGGGGYAEDGDSQRNGSGGGGGGNGAAGTQLNQAGNNPQGQTKNGGQGGASIGTSDLTTMSFGGAGGNGGNGWSGGDHGGWGGNGGGIIFITGATITVAGSVNAGGNNGSQSDNQPSGCGGGGGGAGGSILLKSQVVTLGTTLVTASGGSGAAQGGYGGGGGAGGTGRIHLDYYTSYTGTTTPTLDVTQDSNLVTSTTYQLKFKVSSDGTTANQEFLSKTITSPSINNWYHWAVTWDASESTATFYVNAVSQGTAVGAKTAAYNSTALLCIGAQKNDSGDAENFFHGDIDEVRIFNDIRTANELYANKETEIASTTPNLQAYWQVDANTNDETANANNGTLVDTPTYSTDVPFASPTARQDLDQSLDTSGQTAVTATAISEAATARQSFVPAKDPQKSIQINIADTGDDPDWTITVHDAQNRLVASKTIAFAQITTGDTEFTFATPWRPVIGQTYHFHITTSTTTGAPAVVSTTSNDIETADFHTYFQFLVDDTHHPIQKFLDFLAIGNERYLAKWDGITYSPHVLTLPSGYHIRCLGFWREYLAIGVTIGDALTDYEYGMIFFWDGVSDTYNFYRYVPEGAINSILSGDPMYFVAGYAGDLMKFDGGNPVKIRRMPFVQNADTLSVNRKAITMWRALVHIGFCGTCTSTSLYRGVYSWGTLNQRLPETMSFDYPLSIDITQSANVEIGMVFASGTNLFVSWKNGTSYGMDIVKPSNAPYATGTYESLITDAGKPYQEKEVSVLRGFFKALESGDGFALKYKIDRNSSWVTGATESTTDKKEVRLSIPTKGTRFDELQIGVNLSTSNTQSPEFYGISAEIDTLSEEKRI